MKNQPNILLFFIGILFSLNVNSEEPPQCASFNGQQLDIPCVNAGIIYKTSFDQVASGFNLNTAQPITISDTSQCAVADIVNGSLHLPCVKVIGAPVEQQFFSANMNLIFGTPIRLELLNAALLDTSNIGGSSGSQCAIPLENLNRFNGNYVLQTIRREVGIEPNTVEIRPLAEDICGSGDDYFGDIPAIASLAVTGNQAVISAGDFSFSSSFESRPQTPIRPLVSGTFFEETNQGLNVKNSCGTTSPLLLRPVEVFQEDGGTTTLRISVYTQEDAILIVSRSFFSTGSGPTCNGVIVLQGIKM